jgi:hypothetical protein
MFQGRRTFLEVSAGRFSGAETFPPPLIDEDRRDENRADDDELVE